jgi:hypothetical protein
MSGLLCFILTEAVAKIREIIATNEGPRGGRFQVGSTPGIRQTMGSKTSTVPQPLMSLNPNPTGVCQKIFF